MGLSLLIVDDHEVVREGIVATIGQRYDVVAALPTGSDALNWAKSGNADVALVDFRLPDTTGDILCQQLREAMPGLAVVILTTYSSPEVGRRAARAGAIAYVRKSAGLPALYELLDRLETAIATDGQVPAGHRFQSPSDHDDSGRLTPQQESVLELAARGFTNREIGAQLYISESTVRFHLQKLKTKFSARSKTNLIALAIRSGAISPAPEGADLP
jgi:DNA-binding NarL/FixJ family response regulator